MYTTNRMGIVLRPKQPFLDWANGLDPEGHRLTLDDLREGPTVYLVEEEVGADDYEDVVRHYSTNMAGEWLDSICTDMDRWPPEMPWEMFLKWFDWEILGLVVDLGEPPIRKFTLDDEE